MNSFAGLAGQLAAPQRSWWRRLFMAGGLVGAVMAVSIGARGQTGGAVMAVSDVYGARFISGNKLYADCTAANKDVRTMHCLGYVAAISDVMTFQAVLNGKACQPDRATEFQMRNVVVRFLEAHPEMLRFGAQSLVARALSEAFPCLK